MNHTVRIKICGIKTARIAAAAVQAGADAIGLVFAEKSPRIVTPEQALRVLGAAGPFVDAVGLFVKTPPRKMIALARRLHLTSLQMHGSQDAFTIAQAAPIPVLRAIAFDPLQIEPLLRYYDRLHRQLSHFRGLLIDTPDPARPGGTGRAFDWRSLREALDRVNPKLPIILAGGLTPDNVTRAIEVVRPYAVDVSSGVESRRGVKDAAKIRDFCQAARAASI